MTETCECPRCKDEVGRLVYTSVYDLRNALKFVDDQVLLHHALNLARAHGMKTKANLIRRKINQLHNN